MTGKIFRHMFKVFVILFIAVIFIVLIAMFAKAIYNAIAEKRYNDSQPVLTKAAKITGKRTEVSGGGNDSAVSTAYYATFEFLENRQRLELEIDDDDYGLMAEGDLGKATYQGRRYHQFQRNI